jgi:ribosomal protein S21
MLKKKMQEEKTYQTAMKRYLSQAPKALKKRGEKYPQRKDLYGR